MNRAERRANSGKKQKQVPATNNDKVVATLRYSNVISNMKAEDVPIEKARNGCRKCYGQGIEGKRDDGTVAVCSCVANKIRRGVDKEVADEKAKPEATKA